MWTDTESTQVSCISCIFLFIADILPFVYCQDSRNATVKIGHFVNMALFCFALLCSALTNARTNVFFSTHITLAVLESHSLATVLLALVST